jgi:hypothetical protein
MGNSFTLLLAMVYVALTLMSHSNALGATPTFPEICAKLNFATEGGYTYISPFGGHARSEEIPFEEIARFSPLRAMEIGLTFEETKTRLKRAVQKLPFLSDEAKISITARIDPITLQVFPHEARAKYYAEFWEDHYQVAADESMIDLPKVNVINIFAHELSHAFDHDLIEKSVIKEKGRYILISETEASQYFSDFTVIAREFSSYEYTAITAPLEFAGLTRNQLIEGIPDYFATLATADFISEHPKEQRPQLALEGMMDLIVQGCTREYYYQTRIEKIYFANPQIAKWVTPL